MQSSISPPPSRVYYKAKIASFILHIDKVGGAVLDSLPGPDCALAGTTVASSMHAAAAYKSIRIVAEYHVSQEKNRPARKSSRSFPNRSRCPTPTFSAIFNTRYAPPYGQLTIYIGLITNCLQRRWQQIEGLSKIYVSLWSTI